MQQQILKSIQQGKPPTVIFTLMTLTNVLINLDHGILPACTNQLKEQYQMNQTELGVLGSIVYLGIVLMGIFAGRLYQLINSKILTLGALIALEVSLLLFILSNSKTLAYFCRFLTGVCQVFLLVYYPIWIDKFGYGKKTLWLTLLQICVPVGIFAGYGMTSLVINLGASFKLSFYLQIAMVAVFIIAFALLSKNKLDSRRKLSQDFSNNLLSSPQAHYQKQSMQKKEVTLGSSIVQSTISQPSKKQTSHQSIRKQLKKLWKSKMYFVGTMTMSIILFVSTGIQFWLTDYFINVLHFQRQDVNIAYAVVSITGPTTGCGFGGFVLSKRGGYESPKAVYLVFVFCCIGIGSALFIPFLDGFFACATALWMVLFFGGAMMPGLTGIMMASVPPYLRAFGNSTGQIIKNCFGYLPAPFVYGWFNAMIDDQRAGIKVLMFWGLWAPILLGFGSFYRYKQLKKLDLAKVMKQSAKKRKNSIDQKQVQSKQIDKNQQVSAIISQYLAQEDVGVSSQGLIPEDVIENNNNGVSSLVSEELSSMEFQVQTLEGQKKNVNKKEDQLKQEQKNEKLQQIESEKPIIKKELQQDKIQQ